MPGRGHDIQPAPAHLPWRQYRAVDYRSPSGDYSGQTAYVSLNDLVGARATYIDDDMGKRCFVRKGGWQSGNAAYSMWWNAGTRQCIQGVVSDGRIQSPNPIVEGNCL